MKARVAMIYIPEESALTLREVFRQFDVDCVELQSAEALSRQKVEGCAVGLDHEGAGEVLEILRKSPSNQRALVFGLEQQPNAAAKFLKYGVSVVLRAPLDRITAVKAIRSTRALLLNEFRRYVRIPIAVQISIDAKDGLFGSYTEEVSGGGLSFMVPPNVTMPSGKLRVAFMLPNSSKLSMDATVCWQSHEERSVGVRFEAADPARQVVREWVDKYLQLS